MAGPSLANFSLAMSCGVFIVIGKTGVGKSTFIKLLGGKNGEGQPPDIDDKIDSCKSPIAFPLLVSPYS